MNKFFIMLIAIIFLVLASSCISAQDIDISLSYEPYPAHAGDVLELEFEIENIEASSFNVTFKLDVDDPLTLVSSREKTIYLNAYESKTIKYRVEVDASADEGKEEIVLDYQIEDRSWQSEDFDIVIAPRQVYLEITDVKTDPEQAVPGQEVKVKIKVRNTANSEIKDVILKLDVGDLPFAPQSVTEQRLGSLEEEEEQEIVFNLIVLADAEIKTYKIPLEIKYDDSYGKNYVKEDTIALQVYEEPSIDISIQKNELVFGMLSEIQLRLLNKGLTDVIFVEIKLLESNDYTLAKEYEYIGKIDSDDYETVDFQILPKKQNIVLRFLIEYRDMNNKKFSEVKNIDVRAYTAQEAQALGLLPRFPWTLVIIVIIIIVIIIWRVAARKRKKRLEQEQ